MGDDGSSAGSNLTTLNLTFRLITYYIALNHGKFLSWAHSTLEPPIVHLADFTIWVMTILGYIGLALWAIILTIIAVVLLVGAAGGAGWLLKQVRERT